jgi:hypothetical protein
MCIEKSAHDWCEMFPHASFQQACSSPDPPNPNQDALGRVGYRLGLWQVFLHDVAGGAFARGNAVSTSNPEAILLPMPRSPAPALSILL